MQGGKAFYDRTSSLKCLKLLHQHIHYEHNKGGRHALSYATGL